jgi:DNA-directed RNA polymerase subunit RPC12/RpoP
MIETDTLLEKCPQCGAWPMAAQLPKASSLEAGIRLKCPRCGHQEGGRFRPAERGRRFVAQPARPAP